MTNSGDFGHITPSDDVPDKSSLGSPVPAGAKPDPWSELKKFTAARIALGSSGVSIPVNEVLQFKLAHAHARDAVFSLIDEKKNSDGSFRTVPFYSVAA